MEPKKRKTVLVRRLVDMQPFEVAWVPKGANGVDFLVTKSATGAIEQSFVDAGVLKRVLENLGMNLHQISLKATDVGFADQIDTLKDEIAAVLKGLSDVSSPGSGEATLGLVVEPPEAAPLIAGAVQPPTAANIGGGNIQADKAWTPPWKKDDKAPIDDKCKKDCGAGPKASGGADEGIRPQVAKAECANDAPPKKNDGSQTTKGTELSDDATDKAACAASHKETNMSDQTTKAAEQPNPMVTQMFAAQVPNSQVPAVSLPAVSSVTKADLDVMATALKEAFAVALKGLATEIASGLPGMVAKQVESAVGVVVKATGVIPASIAAPPVVSSAAVVDDPIVPAKGTKEWPDDFNSGIAPAK